MISIHENMTPVDLIQVAKNLGCTAVTKRDGSIQLAAPPGIPQVSSFMRVRIGNSERNGNAVRWLRQVVRALAQRMTVSERSDPVIPTKLTAQEPGYGVTGLAAHMTSLLGQKWKNKALARLRERLTNLRRRD